MQPKTSADYLTLGMRVLVGAWFALIGAEKAFRVGPPAFAEQVASFEIFMDPWNLVVAYLVPWLEMIAGLTLVTSRGLRGGVRVLLGLSGVFLFATVQAWVRGIDVDCGCFGSAFTLGHSQRLWILAAQLGLLILILLTERDFGKRIFGVRPLRLP